jgi:4a-hydroxytetrahydrobiopterin dehydratase
MPLRLNRADIDQGLQQLDHWSLDADDSHIVKAWQFDCFQTAMNFVVQVGELAERLNHHPELLSNYTRVRIRLTTHDANGLTHLDFELARHIDQRVSQAFSDLRVQ